MRYSVVLVNTGKCYVGKVRHLTFLLGSTVDLHSTLIHNYTKNNYAPKSLTHCILIHIKFSSNFIVEVQCKGCCVNVNRLNNLN